MELLFGADGLPDLLTDLASDSQQTLKVTFMWLLAQLPPCLLYKPSGDPVDVEMK